VPFASAVSEHPDPAEAVGEVVGDVLEQVGGAPDLAALFVTEAHTSRIDEIADAVRALLAPRTLIGSTASSVIAGPREVEDRPAISLWAGTVGAGRPVRLDALPGSGDIWGWESLAGPAVPPDGPDARALLVLLADPFSFPTEAFLRQSAAQQPALDIVGGFASAARGPGGNRLVLDGAVHDDGAVGVLLPVGAPVETVVSQGCRPIGEPFTVTRADRNLVLELGSRPALARLEEMVAALHPDDRVLAQGGLHVGIVVDEHRAEFQQGDFLIRGVLGADPERGAVAIGEAVDVGSTVQFQVRDADSADADLRDLLVDRRASGALVFTCNGRGQRLFGGPDHDASVVHEALDGGAVAGMFCAGEIGPVGDRNAIHTFTASIVLFGEPG
jgi:small ligand-binding sensory domain FIST